METRTKQRALSIEQWALDWRQVHRQVQSANKTAPQLRLGQLAVEVEVEVEWARAEH